MNFKPIQVGEYKKINKCLARKLHSEQGTPIWVLPYKLPFDNPVERPYKLPKDGDFDLLAHEHAFYVCREKVGRYLSYYIKGDVDYGSESN